MKLSLLGSGWLPVDSDVFTNTFINSLILKKQISTALNNTNVKMLMGLHLHLSISWIVFFLLLWVKIIPKHINHHFPWLRYLVPGLYRIAKYKVGSRWSESINDLSISLNWDPAIFTQLTLLGKSLTGKQKFQKIKLIEFSIHL